MKYFSEEQRKKEKEMRDKKLLEEKLEKQREKEQKEQQRKLEREEKGKCRNVCCSFFFIFCFLCNKFSHAIWLICFFRGTT